MITIMLEQLNSIIHGNKSRRLSVMGNCLYIVITTNDNSVCDERLLATYQNEFEVAEYLNEMLKQVKL